jgi:hypothetical protein
MHPGAVAFWPADPAQGGQEGLRAKDQPLTHNRSDPVRWGPTVRMPPNKQLSSYPEAILR